MFRSLRVRMAASHAAVIAVILLTLGSIGYLLLARSLSRAATAELMAAAQAQRTLILESGSAVPAPDSDVPSRVAVRIAVFDPGDAPVGEAVEIPPWLRPDPIAVRDLRVAGEPVRIVTLPVRSAGMEIAVVVAGRSLEPEARLLHRVRLLLGAGGAIGIALSLLAGWWMAGRAVRPIEHAYRAQASFAADASHELRTPLAFIRSGVEVLAEDEPELGGQVLSEVDYLTGLSQRMLLLARAERGAVTLERTPFDLAEVCRSAARRSEQTSGTQLTLEGGSATAVGDRVATEASLDAVLENVGVHGGGRADIRWERAADRAIVRVVDHGPGLPPDLGDRAFDRFARADPSRARVTGGAGLGLALARSLVEAQEGQIRLEDTPGGGVTVLVSLPAAREADRTRRE